MHQSHNIPWSIFAEHTKFEAHQPAFPQRPPQLVARGRTGQAKALNYFVRTFVSTLEEFSKTERSKYRPSSEYRFPTTGDIFSDEVRAKHSQNLNDWNQKIENWIEARRHNPTHGVGPRFDGYYYDWNDNDLVRVIPSLVAQNNMDPLLMLANHPDVPIHTLFRYRPFGHELTNLSRVVAPALSSYLLFNILYATGDLDNGNWKRMRWFELSSFPVPDWDLPAEHISHQQFLSLSKAAPTKAGEVVEDLQRPDYQVLHDDLKREFALLYRYDMFLREMGVESPWQDEIMNIIAMEVGGLKVECDAPSVFC
ncbi:hypothetical protein BKA70DRAFT_1125868 [Coprinopsis sp. MPI-PUGE-AT-0042]|nr:hypothetical protein BKA70DRAFT_1125868 [Coprinopsis sp. MPI-PUGE-AT-0042]